MWKES